MHPSETADLGSDDQVSGTAISPIARKRGKKPRPHIRPLLLITIIGGSGLIALTACGFCGVGGYFLFFSRPAVAGKWRMTNPAVGVTIDFHANGTGVMRSPGADIQFDYTVSREDAQILEWRITSVDRREKGLGKQFGKRAIAPHGELVVTVNNEILVGAVVERFRVTMRNDTLILAKEGAAQVFTLRKAP